MNPPYALGVPQPTVTLPLASTAAHPIGPQQEHHKYHPSNHPFLFSLLLNNLNNTSTSSMTTAIPPKCVPDVVNNTNGNKNSLKQTYQERQRAYVNALVGKLHQIPTHWASRVFLNSGYNDIDVTVQAIASIWPNAMSSTPSSSSSGSGARPIANLNTFLHHILKHSRTTHSTLQLAIFYLFRIRPRVLERRHEDVYIACGRRMFLAALICAHKFLQDKTYKNSAWSKVSGLGVAEVNHAEKVMLHLLDWSLFVKKDTYDQWIVMLQTHLKQRIPVPPSSLSSEDIQQQQQEKKPSIPAANNNTATVVKLGMPTPVEEGGIIKQPVPCVVDTTGCYGLLSPPERKRKADDYDTSTQPSVRRRLDHYAY